MIKEQEGFIIETSIQIGLWEVNSDVVYLDEEHATDIALMIMKDSDKKVLARVKKMKIIN